MQASQAHQSYIAEMVAVRFEVPGEDVRRVLPPPLETTEPIVTAMVGSWRSSCLGTFKGGALNVDCRYGETVGSYTLAMYMDDFRSVAFGREFLGEPKKLAEAVFERSSNRVRGLVRRDGVALIDLDVSAEREAGPYSYSRSTFNVKAVHRADGQGLESDAILTVSTTKLTLNSYVEGNGAVALGGTVHDPLDEIHVTQVLQASVSRGAIETTCRPLARIPASEFLPYAYGRLDYWPDLGTTPPSTR